MVFYCFSVKELWNVFKIKDFMSSYWYCQFIFRTTNNFLNLINMPVCTHTKNPSFQKTDMISHLFYSKRHRWQPQNYNINITTINFSVHLLRIQFIGMNSQIIKFWWVIMSPNWYTFLLSVFTIIQNIKWFQSWIAKGKYIQRSPVPPCSVHPFLYLPQGGNFIILKIFSLFYI